MRSQIHSSAFNLKKVMCGQPVLSLPDSQRGMQANNATLPIFNQPELRQDLTTYLDIVTDYTQQTKGGLRNIASQKPVPIRIRQGIPSDLTLSHINSSISMMTNNLNTSMTHPATTS